MIKIRIKGRLKFFSDLKKYISFKKNECCIPLYITLYLQGTNPPLPTGCFNGNINYSGFISIDFTSIGGTVQNTTVINNNTALINYLATLGIVVTIQGCVITIVSGLESSIYLPVIK